MKQSKRAGWKGPKLNNQKHPDLRVRVRTKQFFADPITLLPVTPEHGHVKNAKPMHMFAASINSRWPLDYK